MTGEREPVLAIKHAGLPVVPIKFGKGPILSTMHPFLSILVPGFVRTGRC